MNNPNYNRNFRNNQVVKKPFNPNIDWFEKAKVVIEAELERRQKITSSQLRNLLNILVNLKNDFEKENLEQAFNEEQMNKLRYAKVKMVYQIAREGNQAFYEEAQIEEKLNLVKNKKDFDELLNYMEALVAYHKYYIK